VVRTRTRVAGATRGDGVWELAVEDTRRESSTQQSEYSKARRRPGLSGSPAGSRLRSRVRVPGRRYEFRLVREALMEREVLWAMAPHIVWPLRFVLPHRSIRASRTRRNS
jgi:hypothetical protein